MFKIVWDKEAIERNIISKTGTPRLLDFWVPVRVYVDGVDITGYGDIPGGDITQFYTFSLNLLSVFQAIDPKELGGKRFCLLSNVKNEVSGGGFKFFIYPGENDKLTIKYKNRAIPEFREAKIPARSFAEGVLSATSEVIRLIESMAGTNPELKEDGSYLCLRDDLKKVLEWYRQRYGK